MAPPGVRKLDLFQECNDQHVAAKDFMAAFCNRCKNPQCVHAGWSVSSWSERMATQVDRLLNYPLIADPKDPKWENIRKIHFMEPEPSLTLRDPWAGPEVHLARLENQRTTSDLVDHAVSVLTGNLNLVAKDVPRVTVPEPVISEPVVSNAPTTMQPVDTVPVTEKPVVSPPKTPLVHMDMNTRFPDVGVMVGGGAAPGVLTKPQQSAQAIDPWAPKTVKGKLVPPGAKIKMGG